MDRRAYKRASLRALVKLALPMLRHASRECPRTGPGRPRVFDAWAIGALIMVAVLTRRKSKSSQYAYLQRHRHLLKRWLDLDELPVRSTFFNRYQDAYLMWENAVRRQALQALREGVANAQCVSVDKSLLAARGPVWHQRQRARGIKPRGVDGDASWSYSQHHGWVYGYGLEVVVTAGKTGVVFPLLASVATAKVREAKTFPRQIAALPDEVKYVLADSGYDTNDLAEAIEWTAAGRRTGRRFLCRQVSPRRPRTKTWRETHRRQRRRLRREARRKYFQTKHARRLYRRRGRTVEPYFQWFKNLFDLDQRVWQQGLKNNSTQLLAAVFCYQLLLRYNHHQGWSDGQIQWILDSL